MASHKSCASHYAIARLAGPALVSLTMAPLLSAGQVALLGTRSTEDLAALGLCQALFALVLRTFNFLEYATTPIVAKRVRGDFSGGAQTTCQALGLALSLGVIITMVLLVGTRGLVTWIGADAALVERCVAYVRIRAVAAPAELCVMAGKGTFRGLGDTATPAAVTLVTTLLGFALGVALVVKGDGVAGLAVASAVTSVSTAGALIWHLNNNGYVSVRELVSASHLVWRRSDGVAAASLLMQYLRAAGSLFVRSFLLQSAVTALAAEAVRRGTIVAAAATVLKQCTGIFSLALDSLAVAAQSLVAERIGRGDVGGAISTSKRLLELGLQCAIVLVLILLYFRHALVAAFTHDAAVAVVLHQAIPFVAAMQLVASQAYVLDGIFLGAADFSFLGLTMALCASSCVFATWLLSSHSFVVNSGGLLGVVAGHAVLMTARTIALLWRLLWARSGPFAARSQPREKLN